MRGKARGQITLHPASSSFIQMFFDVNFTNIRSMHADDHENGCALLVLVRPLIDALQQVVVT
jgi:hypothetical protein